MTMHEILMRGLTSIDILDLGERFELAKALVSTVFEIHTMGWVHKNIHLRTFCFGRSPMLTLKWMSVNPT